MPPRSREEIQLRNNLWAPRGGTSASSRAHPTTASFNESGANGSGHHSEHRDSPHPAKRHPSGGGGTGGGRQDGTAALPLPAASRAHSCTLQPSAHPDAKPGAGLHRTAAQTPRSHLPKGLRLIAHRPDRESTSVSSGQREGLKGSAARSAEPTGDRQQPRQPPPHTDTHTHGTSRPALTGPKFPQRLQRCHRLRAPRAGLSSRPLPRAAQLRRPSVTERPRAARSPRLPPSIPPSLRTAQTLRTSAPPAPRPPFSEPGPPAPPNRASRPPPPYLQPPRPPAAPLSSSCGGGAVRAPAAERAAGPARSSAPLCGPCSHRATAFPLIAGRGRAWQHPPARPGAGGGARGVNEGPEPLTGNCWREPRDAEMVGPGAPPDEDGLRAPGLRAWGTEG